MLTKRTSKNQITLPKEIADKFPDTLYFDVVLDKDQILLRPVQIVISQSSLSKVRLKVKKLGITEKDINEAIAWSRKSTK